MIIHGKGADPKLGGSGDCPAGSRYELNGQTFYGAHGLTCQHGESELLAASVPALICHDEWQAQMLATRFSLSRFLARDVCWLAFGCCHD